MQLLRTLPGKPDWTDRSSYLPQWLNPRAGKMKRILHSDWLLERARPLRISRVGPARKSSLFGHTINPLLPSLFIQLNKNANENFANIDTEN